MFQFTYTIIRELQPALSKNYISGFSTRVVIDVFSAMEAYAAIALKTSIYTRTRNVILAKCGL
jgi:hypothetical protein